MDFKRDFRTRNYVENWLSGCLYGSQRVTSSRSHVTPTWWRHPSSCDCTLHLRATTLINSPCGWFLASLLKLVEFLTKVMNGYGRNFMEEYNAEVV